MINMRMKIDTAKFGEFIAKRREKIYGKESQLLLAEKLHIAGPTLSNIEKGKRFLSFSLFIDLADALQMTPGELMMVLAEREQSPNGYMEMNDWLYNKLLRVVLEYQDHSKNRPMTQEQLTALQELMQDRERLADEIADKTPDVESENTARPQIIINTPIENS